MILRVEEVSGACGARLFAEAARHARAGDPLWNAPFSLETVKLFHGEKTPFNRRNPHAFLVAFKGARPMGRVMVVQNLDHLALHRDNAAHFGFLEAADGSDIIPALMKAATEWARARGLTRLEGPYSASINHEIGLLVENKDGRPTTFKTNDAPPRYAEALEALGFQGIQDIVAYEADVVENAFSQRARATLERWSGRDSLKLRSFNPLRFKESVALTNAIYADAWADNWRATPPTEDEARFIAGMTLPWIKPAWLRVAEWEGRPAGVLSMIPDLNEAARGLDGKLFPFGWARFAGRLKLGKIKRARIALIGVSRTLRGTRAGGMVAAALLADAMDSARRAGIKQVEISWMLAENAPVINLVKSLPARHTKTWRIFGKEI